MKRKNNGIVERLSLVVNPEEGVFVSQMFDSGETSFIIRTGRRLSDDGMVDTFEPRIEICFSLFQAMRIYKTLERMLDPKETDKPGLGRVPEGDKKQC